MVAAMIAALLVIGLNMMATAYCLTLAAWQRARIRRGASTTQEAA